MIKHLVIAGLKWQFLSRIAQKALSVLTFTILARILKPSDFGLFAMAFVVLDGLLAAQSLGLKSSLIQKTGDDETNQNTAFWITLGMGITLFLVCFLGAPWAGAFFEEENLIPILRILGILFITKSIYQVAAAVLNKSLRFKDLSLFQLAGALTNSLVAIGLALIFKNAWALVIAYLVRRATITGLFWFFSKYKPRFIFSIEAAKSLLSFGKFIVLSKLINYGASNLFKIIVGKLLGAASLGFITLSANLGRLVEANSKGLITNVLFPAYSKIQNDHETLQRSYINSVKFVSLLSFPAGALLIILADEITRVLYGEQWLAIIPLIKLWAVTQFFSPILMTSKPIFLACGKANYLFRLTTLSLLLSIPLLALLVMRMGVVGAVISELAIVASFAPLYLILLRKTIGLSLRKVIQSLTVPLIASLTLMASLAMADRWLSSIMASENFLNSLITAGASSVVGGIVYLGTLWIIDRSSVQEAKEILLGDSNRLA